MVGGGMRPETEGSLSSAGAVISRLRPCKLLNIVLCTYGCSQGRDQIKKKATIKIEKSFITRSMKQKI